MEYDIGDKVMHPSHGGGRIVKVEHVELVEGFEHYYAIEIPDKSMTLHIPMRKMEELGVRPVMAAPKMARVMETLGGLPQSLDDNYKVRQAKVRHQLKSGLPLQIAEAVRDLTWREEQDSLTQGDLRLLNQARDILAAELALVQGVPAHEARTTIEMAVQRGMQDVQSA